MSTPQTPSKSKATQSASFQQDTTSANPQQAEESIPRSLYDNAHVACRRLFTGEFLENLSLRVNPTKIRFWKPKEPLTLKTAEREWLAEWLEGINDLTDSFELISLPESFANALERDIDDRCLVHLVVTATGPYQAAAHDYPDHPANKERPLVDDHGVIKSWRSKRSKSRLPSVEELREVLAEPLADSEKVSITQLMYTSLISSLSPDKCTEDDIGSLFKIGELDPDLSRTVLAVSTCSPAGGTEESFHSFWDRNIRELLELLIPTGKSIRNGNRNTLTRMLRPDFGFLLKKICLFRGEENGPESSEDPKAELADKFNWVYEPAPYMLGYYCNGSKMTLTVITPPSAGYQESSKPRLHDIVSTDLRWRKDRIANIRHLINLSSILPRLSELVQSPVDDFQLFERKNSTVEITSTLVVKTYTCKNAEAKVDHLRRIYAVLLSRSIPNTDLLIYTKGNVAHLTPRGIPWHPRVEKELRECLICVLESLIVAHQVPLYHRDIRWNNVIRRINDDSKWFLIDWEDASTLPTKAEPSFSTSSHSPDILHDDHGPEVDIWGVGYLVMTCRAADVSTALKALGERICKESHSLSAQEVLGLVNTSYT